jgi:predicted metal-dependent phosphoesterase TrpH
MRLDLHMHTTASDGAWSPAAVVESAAAGGLDVIAITDHDTTAAVSAAERAAAELNLEVISGVELSSTHEGRDVHILGYFVDTAEERLVAHAKRAERRREERMQEMVDRLQKQGIEVSYADVERAAGEDRVVIGRPHLASALVTGGYANSVYDAFDRLIGDNHPAFVPTHLVEPAGAVEVVLAAGGIPVWAHPPGDLVDPLLPGLKAAGLQGLEVYRPRHKRSEVLRLESICKSTGLLMTGGSDWHTPDAGASLGDFYVSSDEVERFLSAGGM